MLPTIVEETLRKTQYSILLQREPPLMEISKKFDQGVRLQSICAVAFDKASGKATFSDKSNLDIVIIGYIEGRVAEMRANGKDFYATFEPLYLASGRF